MAPEGSSRDPITGSLARLVTRNPGRTEADIQADVRDVLLYGGFDLGDEAVLLESSTDDHRRLDVAVGALIVECKKDLRPPAARAKAEVQLGEYLAVKASSGGRYAGVLTDGAIWRLYRHGPRGQAFVDELVLNPTSPDDRALRWWLGAVLATEQAVVPSASAIEERLGALSPSFRLIRAALLECWDSVGTHPTVDLKRQLWAKLLRSALGSQFEDTAELFVEHTYLVLLANLIGHAVVGFDLNAARNDPGVLLSGQLFERAGFSGVGQAGFFDWPLDSPAGGEVVSDVARRLASFSWAYVDHDVLKVLYQSVISPDVRHRLGEYYTPDWLAEMMVAQAVTDPLTQRVLDPACGSGTFIFHAVRRYLETADSAGVEPAAALEGVTSQVFGVDLHPVAVALAQTTFLLAVGPERLAKRTGTLNIPVYLGDSMRWDAAEESVFTAAGDVVVYTTDGGELFASELRFPAAVVADVGGFDHLVNELAGWASNRPPGTPAQPIAGVLKNLHIPVEDRPTVEATYNVLCTLYDQGRNHIWGFYIRNQARPTWLARPENRVDVLVGNPPWLAYRFMPEAMQAVFQRRAKERKLWMGGGRGRTTQQDLSAFFVARSIELYLRVGGRFAFVMPRAVLSRQTYGGFRAGDWSSVTTPCFAAFDTPWDLKDVRPDPFPVPSSVVFGKRAAAGASGLGEAVTAFAGKAPGGGSSGTLTSTADTVESVTGAESASVYKERFRQGAILVPRMLIMVGAAPTSPLGVPQGRRAVTSRKTSLDKPPWKDLPAQQGVVESIFLRPALLGESIGPFRVFGALEAVIPYDGTRLLEGNDERVDRYPGLAEWCRTAEETWISNRSSDKRTLLGQFDYMHQLSAQFPVAALRVVYTKAGNNLCAAIIDDSAAVVDHSLYWAPVASMDEARYLVAILNATALNDLVRPYQAVGAFGPRHFDKYIWQMPIPGFNTSSADHRALADLAEQAEKIAEDVEIPVGLGFQRARKHLRDRLIADGVLGRIDIVFNRILSGGS
ncbi:MAG TPA: N-6 DNA methylase [Acidimicrobiales bacterium]|nr:N-6 DNA methylase [Acidimicrobiales bacterium]